MQVDGGSNCNLLSSKSAAKLGPLLPASGTIGGIAAGLPYTGVSHLAAGFLGGNPSPHGGITLASLFTPKGTRNILSESVLLDEYGILAPKEPPCLTGGVLGDNIIPMERKNGLFYVDLELSASATRNGKQLGIQAIANAGSVRADDEALLWAARLDTDSDGLLKLSRATKGIGI
jgi:hypothetical protein